MEKSLMRSLKDSHSEILQTTVCSSVHSFFHVVSNSLHIPWNLISSNPLQNTSPTLSLSLHIKTYFIGNFRQSSTLCRFHRLN
jgi:hypothetical protein